MLTRYVQAFPDLQFSGEAISEGNRVALDWIMTGTHHGTFMHISATGRRITVRGVSLLTIEAGNITRGVSVWGTAGVMRAVGLLLELDGDR